MMTVAEYIRDGRAPIPESELTSKVMSKIKGKNTGPEIAMRKALREVGLPGYRLHWKKASGRPDIAYPKHKIAIFVHGCFWHSCPHCNPHLPKSHTKFWLDKLERNKERDAKKVLDLEESNWKVLVFWECEIKKNALDCAEKIKDLMVYKV